MESRDCSVVAFSAKGHVRYAAERRLTKYAIDKGIEIIIPDNSLRARNMERFETLLKFTHSHFNGKYTLYDNEGKSVEAVYDTDYESDNGLDEDEEGYEDYHCIAFKRISDGIIFLATIWQQKISKPK